MGLFVSSQLLSKAILYFIKSLINKFIYASAIDGIQHTSDEPRDKLIDTGNIFLNLLNSFKYHIQKKNLLS